jgi:hypothetical protein
MDISIKLGTAKYDALVEALDQYCANQSEYEETEHEGKEPSEKLQAAQEMLDQLNAMVEALADRTEH